MINLTDETSLKTIKRDPNSDEPIYAVLYYLYRRGAVGECSNYTSLLHEDVRTLGIFIKEQFEGKLDIKRVREFANKSIVSDDF